MFTQVDKDAVRRTLTHLLREKGIQPDGDWLSIRVSNPPGTDDRYYALVIGSAPAKAALCPALDRFTGQRESKSKVGVWVLSEPEARSLCERRALAE